MNVRDFTSTFPNELWYYLTIRLQQSKGDSNL